MRERQQQGDYSFSISGILIPGKLCLSRRTGGMTLGSVSPLNLIQSHETVCDRRERERPGEWNGCYTKQIIHRALYTLNASLSFNKFSSEYWMSLGHVNIPKGSFLLVIWTFHGVLSLLQHSTTIFFLGYLDIPKCYFLLIICTFHNVLWSSNHTTIFFFSYLSIPQCSFLLAIRIFHGTIFFQPCEHFTILSFGHLNIPLSLLSRPYVHYSSSSCEVRPWLPVLPLNVVDHRRSIFPLWRHSTDKAELD